MNQTGQQGFTLVEVMVALIIVAVSLPALMFSISTQVNQLSYVEEKLLGQWVASNEIAKLNVQYRQSGVIPKGKKSGTELMANRKWSWSSTSKQESGVVAQGIYSVKLELFTEENSESPIASQSSAYFDKTAKISNLAQLLNTQASATGASQTSGSSSTPSSGQSN